MSQITFQIIQGSVDKLLRSINIKYTFYYYFQDMFKIYSHIKGNIKN